MSAVPGARARGPPRSRMLEPCQEVETQKRNWLLDAIRSNLGERDPTLAKYEVAAQTYPRADMKEKLKANPLHSRFPQTRRGEGASESASDPTLASVQLTGVKAV